MIAAVATMTDEDRSLHARAAAAARAYHAALETMQASAEAAGLPVHGASPLGHLFAAGHRFAGFWERRAKLTERALRAILASDAISETQRAEIIDVLHGRHTIGRDRQLLNDHERALLDHYRASTAASKRMVRTVAELAARDRGTR